MRFASCLLVFAALAASLSAQDADRHDSANRKAAQVNSDAPVLAVPPGHLGYPPQQSDPPTVPTHRFWDAANTAGVVAMVGFASADAAQTCNYQATFRNFHELPFPAGSPLKPCAGSTVYIAATKLASFVGMRAAHDSGRHRLERAIPWVNAGLSAFAVFKAEHDSGRGVKYAR